MAGELTHGTLDKTPDSPDVYRGPALGDAPKISPSAECGACDPTFDKVRSRFMPFVFARGNFLGVSAAEDASKKLTFAATSCDSPIKLWAAGVGEDGSSAGFPAGYKLTASDTNAGKQGRIVPQDYGFVLAGILFRVVNPVTISVTSGVATIGYGAWTDAFVKDMVAMLLERISATLSFGRDGEKAGSLGNLGQWAQQSGLVHPDAPTNGVPYNNQFLMMFMGAFSGGTEDVNQITIDLSIDNAVVIHGKTNSTTIDSDVNIGIECQLMGYYVCPDDLGVCAPGEVEKLKRNLALLARTNPEMIRALMAATSSAQGTRG